MWPVCVLTVFGTMGEMGFCVSSLMVSWDPCVCGQGAHPPRLAGSGSGTGMWGQSPVTPGVSDTPMQLCVYVCVCVPVLVE